MKHKLSHSFLTDISLSDLINAKNIINKFNKLNLVAKDVANLKGIANLYQWVGDVKFAEKIQEQLKKDSAVVPYITSDLASIGCMKNKAINEMLGRIDKVVDNIENLKDISGSKRRKLLDDVRQTPETYFKFGRSEDVKRNGFTPNYFSEALENAGYNKEKLTKLMSLIHLPACCTTSDEWKFLHESRMLIPPVKEGYKVMHVNESWRHLGFGEKKGTKNFTGVAGFWADANLYNMAFDKAELTYGVLRIDFEGTPHVVNGRNRTYAIYFDASDVGDNSIIPLDREIGLDKDGRLKDNLPHNPFTGNGFTSTRNHMIVPENKIPYQTPYKFQNNQMLFGYFDKTGEFNPTFAFMEGKWKLVKEFFLTHKEMKTLEDDYIERNASTEKITNRPIDRKNNDLDDRDR